MTLVQVRTLARCPAHGHTVVVLDATGRRRRRAFYADPQEAQRLARQLAHGPRACHPVLDFIRALLAVWRAVPARVVLDDVAGQGLGAMVCLRQGGREVAVPCYPPDALALALRVGVPIYATEAALAHGDRAGPPEPDGEDLAGWLDRLRPEDFALGGDGLQ